jgi:prepilin-type N-terminal cleavage/methylation domain-containing protein
MAGSRRPSPSPVSLEDGFTIIEVIVATVILLVGVMGVLSVVVQSDGVSASNRIREQGIALQRELIEAARSIPYEQLTQGTLVSRISSQTGLTGSTMTAKGWTFRRRNVDYTVAVGTCAVDDPIDKTGPHESAGYCLDGTGSTTPTECLAYLGSAGSIAGVGTAGVPQSGDCGIDTNYDGAVDGLVDTAGGPCTNCAGADTNPNDYKRIVVLVRWTKGLGKRYALQSTTLPNPGLAAAPAITSLTQPSKPIVQGDPDSLPFTATFNTPPAAVPWYVSSTLQGQATPTAVDTVWTFNWNLGSVNYTGTTPNVGEVLDGTYSVSAKGVDAYGQAGTSKASTVILNRRWPYPPSNLHAGRNNGAAYLDWGANSERDIIGYRVYRKGSPDQLVCDVALQTRCRDGGLPSSYQEYYVRAIDRDSQGVVRTGDNSAVASVPDVSADNPPSAPGAPKGAASGTDMKLVWGASGDIDPGDSIRFYRIYRDGTDWVDNYFGQTSNGSTLQFVDTATNGESHSYWVVAVDQSYTESAPAPVTLL